MLWVFIGICVVALLYPKAQRVWLHNTTVALVLRAIDCWICEDESNGLIGPNVAAVLRRQVRRELKRRLVGWRRDPLMGEVACENVLQSLRNDLPSADVCGWAALMNAQNWLQKRTYDFERVTRFTL